MLFSIYNIVVGEQIYHFPLGSTDTQTINFVAILPFEIICHYNCLTKKVQEKSKMQVNSFVSYHIGEVINFSVLALHRC